MNRATAVVGNDVRLQVRYGLYGVSIVMVLFWGVVLGWLARGAALPRELLVSPFIIINLIITTFYFMAALVLFEKSEGVLTAIVTTPLSPVPYLFSKAVSLSLLATAETLLIVALVFGGVSVRLAIGAFLLGVFYGLAGFIAVVRFDSINRFLVPSVPIVMLLLLPLLAHFRIAGTVFFFLHPVQQVLFLVNGVDDLSVIASLLWIALAALFARRDYRRFVVRA